MVKLPINDLNVKVFNTQFNVKEKEIRLLVMEQPTPREMMNISFI
jgi:hypothetical protein